MTIKPERELRIIWYMNTLIVYAVTAVALLSLYFFTDLNVWVIVGFAAVWIISLIIILIWNPAAYKALEYYIEQDAVIMKGGVFWRKKVTVPNRKITNIDITQGPFERFLKLSTVRVQTAGAGGQQGQKAELRITGVREMEEIKNAIVDNINSGSRSSSVSIPPSSSQDYAKKPPSSLTGESQILSEILTILKSINEKVGK